jgi:hypothetical protein
MTAVFLALTINGTSYNIANGPFNVSDGGTYNIRVVAIGTSIKVYANGTLIISFTDSRLQTNTYHGMGIFRSGGVTPLSRFDNFIVKNP